MTFAAVMFDMDGLLLDTEAIYLETFVDTRVDFGLSPSPDAFLRCVGLVEETSKAVVVQSLEGKVDYEPFVTDWDRRIADRIAKGIPTKPGVKELLSGLASCGMPMGVATSTKTMRARHHLEECGLLPFLSHVVGRDLVAHRKPNPEPYLKLAELLGVSPSDCIAFEDSDVGTRAAFASGAYTVQVPDLVQPSVDVRNLGHIIAPSLLDGAAQAGLIKAVA